MEKVEFEKDTGKNNRDVVGIVCLKLQWQSAAFK